MVSEADICPGHTTRSYKLTLCSPGERLYILIEKGTTFQLKSIPLIEVKPVALRTQKQRKTDDKHGYQTRDYQTIFSGVR